MLAKPQGFPRKLGGCAGLDPRLRSAVSAGVGDGERGLRRGLRAPGVGVRPKWVLEYSPSNKRIRYFVSITYVRTGLWTAHKFCGGGKETNPTTTSPIRAKPALMFMATSLLLLASGVCGIRTSEIQSDRMGIESPRVFTCGTYGNAYRNPPSANPGSADSFPNQLTWATIRDLVADTPPPG